MYFSLNGKLVRSYKIRSYLVSPPGLSLPPRYQLIDYPESQKHVPDLFSDMLQGVASPRIQFYIIPPWIFSWTIHWPEIVHIEERTREVRGGPVGPAMQQILDRTRFFSTRN